MSEINITPALVNITLLQGDTLSQEVTVTEGGVAVDYTGCSAAMDIAQSLSGEVVLSLTDADGIAFGSSGLMTITVTAAQSEVIPAADYKYDLELTTDQTETYSANVDGSRVQPGYSDIPGTLDITALTTLDCTAAWAQYRGIYNLTSSNATEAIDAISNSPTLFPFTLRPAAGLVLTVTGTAIATPIGAGQIALTTADIVLDGDKGEYLELVADPTNTYLVEKSRLTGIV